MDKDLESIENFIDHMPIYESDYQTLMGLIENMDDSLFLKFMEEVKDGNLTISDFARVIEADGYDGMLSESFESQEKLYRKYIDTAKYLSGIGLLAANERLSCLAALDSDKAIGSTTVLMSDIDRKNAISAIMSGDPAEDPMTEFYKNAILKGIANSGTSKETIDKLLLSAHEYLVPVDFDSITITNADRVFMNENSIGEDEMRKIKSLAAFSAESTNA